MHTNNFKCNEHCQFMVIASITVYKVPAETNLPLNTESLQCCVGFVYRVVTYYMVSFILCIMLIRYRFELLCVLLGSSDKQLYFISSFCIPLEQCDGLGSFCRTWARLFVIGDHDTNSILC